MASAYGHPEYAITAKKQEFPGYDPRGAKGMGLLYATSNKGASHMAGDIAYSEAFGVPEKINPLSIERKPELVARFEDAFAIIDAAGLCVFLSVRNMFADSVELWPTNLTTTMNYATGAGYTEESLLQAGERIFNLERMFLLRAGFTKADDTLPKRMLEEPLPDGGAKGHIVELDQMLPAFYKARGWDENGVPTEKKLKELDITK
jgi:aldehyde:ferredoxin oxidoreductase